MVQKIYIAQLQLGETVRRILLPVILVCLFLPVRAQQKQNEFTGKVSYITSQNIYVRFDGTNDLLVGDTVFINAESSLVPLMLIESKSSYSVVGKPFPDVNVSLGQEVIGRSHRVKANQIKSETASEAIKQKPTEAVSDSIELPHRELDFKQKIRGRIAASSFSAFSNATSSDSHRMRYSLSLQANNINNSRISAEVYTNFSYLTSDWAAVKDNLFNALKIYSLAVRYQAGSQSDVWLGRKINPNLSNIGAIDGLQYETGVSNFRFGAVVGFRPDYFDYGFNSDLLEYGVYAAHQANGENGSVRSSLAFFNQTNSGKTDRRFLYFQHRNSLLKHLFFFLSSEVDLYKTEAGQGKNTTSLTSFYVSLRYRINRQLWADASYDNRKHVIYYETFKSLVDQLMEEATRQGVQFRINYRPVPLITIGVNSTYRKRDTDAEASTSYQGFLSFNQIPDIEATISLSANSLKTVYVDGAVYGMRFFKDFASGKFSTSIGYRYIDYQFNESDHSLLQHAGELDFSWRVTRKFSVAANYEAVFEKTDHYNRIYINLTKRF